jgi:hypothetical protein
LKIYIILIFILFTYICPSSVKATVYKQINFEWEYDTDLSELAGYILYQDGILLHTIKDPKALSIDLDVGLEPGKITAFTMRAFDTKGNESALSVPYNLVVPIAVENNNFLPLPMITTNYRDEGVVDLTALSSTDFDGTIINYAWYISDGTQSTSPSISHTFSTSGTYTVTLTVTDNSGGKATAQSFITVSYPNTPSKGIINLKIKLMN